ncbi:MAG TPA: isochorismatase family cysteine hydrolase [Nitrospira sp.]|nr:isochorismatase family cysteine hydrolase [Nitrospira sp.]
MTTKKLDEASAVVNTSGTGPSRREILVHGSKVVVGIGIATLFGNWGTFSREAYGMDRSTMSLLDSLTPARTALLVIDMQRDFLLPEGYAAQAGLDIAPLVATVRPIEKLLAVGRKAGLLIVHTREGHVPDLSDCPPYKLERSRRAGAEIGSKGPLGRLLVRGEIGHDFVEAVRPLEQEIVIDKPGYSAFAHTGLQQVLTNRGIETLILTGVTTEVCVSSTLRAAIDLGYRCITVSDACASGDLALHKASLAMIAVEGGIFGEVATTAEVVERFAR